MSNQTLRTQRYLRACADFVDHMRGGSGAWLDTIIRGDANDGYEVRRDAVDEFLAKAQEKSS